MKHKPISIRFGIRYNRERLIPTLGLLFFVVAVFVYSDIEASTYISNFAFIVLTLITFVTIMTGSGRFSVKRLNVFLPILVFSILTLPAALNTKLALQKTVTIAELILMVLIINNCVKSGRIKFKTLVFSLMLGGLAVTGIIILVYGIDNIIAGILSGTRIGEYVYQLNMLGRYTYYGAVSAFFFLYYRKKIVCAAVFVPTVLVCLGSESRQAIFALVIAILLLFLLKDFSKRRTLQLIVRMIIVAVALMLILRFPGLEAVRLRIMNGLTASSQSAAIESDRSRIEMIVFGFKTFLHYPVFGIGLGNVQEVVSGTTLSTRHYLHNNYIELLTCGGLVGFLAYYWIYYQQLSSLWLSIKKYGLRHELAFSLALIIGQLVLDFFAVTYYSKIQYILFAFVFLAIDYAEADNNRGEEHEKRQISRRKHKRSII